MAGQDFISALPDHMLIMILSFLDMKEIMRTSVLSKKFEYIWAMVSTLVFKEGNEFRSGFIPWVDHVLLRRSIVDVSIKKLKIDCQFTISYTSNVDEWLRIAQTKHVENLTLHLREEKSYHLPHHICNNTSLVKLSLSGCKFQPPQNFEWPSLVKLSLSQMEVKCDIFSRILSATPMLKHMELVNCGGREPLDINSTSLVELVIKGIGLYGNSTSKVSAPNLKFLHLAGSSCGSFQLMNVSSLYLVVLDFTFFRNYFQTLCDYYTQLLNNLLHVQYLEVGQQFIQAIAILEARGLRPPLSFSRTWLKLNVHVDPKDIPGIAYMLKGSPNVENVELCLAEHNYLINYMCTGLDCYLETYWCCRFRIFHIPLLKLRTATFYGFNSRSLMDELKLRLLKNLVKNNGTPISFI